MLRKSILLLEACRPHQWVKNLLLVVPALLAHYRLDEETIKKLIIAVISFSAIASAIYLFNDLVDLRQDRLHPVKKNRVLARGDLSTPIVLILFLCLVALSIWLGWQLSIYFVWMIGFYILFNLIYSFKLKHVTIVNALMLATFYNWRILSGGIAAGILISPWLLGFSNFFFLSLASCKKCADINVLATTSSSATDKVYEIRDLQFLSVLGLGSGLLSVLVLAIYITQEDVLAHYSHSEFLWILCLVLLYWIMRQWLLTSRQKMLTDPVLFAVKDSVTYFVGVLVLVILFLAR